MKRISGSAARHRAAFLLCAAAVLVAFGATLPAAAAATARVTRTVKSVKLVPPQGAARAASLNDLLPAGAALRTGPEARAELTFPDRTLARLGGNTVLRIPTGTRDLQLDEGAVLFHAPKSARGGRITTGTITTEITGTTGLFERNGTAYFKFLVLEGTARVYLRKLGESVLVHAGEMLIGRPDAKVLPEPVHFNIEHLYRTSLLTQGGFAPLASAGAIQQAIRKQKSDPRFFETNLIIYGRGTLVNLVEPSPSPAGRPTASPVGAPRR